MFSKVHVLISHTSLMTFLFFLCAYMHWAILFYKPFHLGGGGGGGKLHILCPVHNNLCVLDFVSAWLPESHCSH